MKTERITFLMTTDEKTAITKRAAQLHIPASELIRRAVESYDPDRGEDEIEELARELRLVVEATERKVDKALERLAALEAQAGDRDRLRAEARAEIEASGLAWPFSSTNGQDILGNGQA